MMNHLTVDEIIDFVTVNELNDETKALVAKVNLHIFTCEECLKKVRAFQALYEEIVRSGRELDARRQMKKRSDSLRR